MNTVKITIPEETKIIIETFGKTTVEGLLEKMAAEMKKNHMNGNISIKNAALLMGKSQQFIRVGLQRGLLPFGHAVRISGMKYSYHISPKLFYEYIGKIPDKNTSN